MEPNTTNSNPAPAPAPAPTPAPTPVVAQPTPAAQPAPAEQPVIAQKPKAEGGAKPKSKGKVGLIIGIIVGVLVIVGVVLLIMGLTGGGLFTKHPIYEADAFWLKDKDSKYILFSKSGERLSEEKFDDVEDFHNGMSLVEKDGKTGVINDKGKMTIEFGQYESSIYEVGAGLYGVSVDAGKDGLVYQLINGEGRVITEAKSAFLSNAFIGDSDVPFVAVKDEDNYYDIYNTYGQRVMTIQSSSEPVFEVVNEYNSDPDDYKYYASISYDKGFAVYDANNLKELAKIEEGISTRYEVRRAIDDKHFYAIEYYDDYRNNDERVKLYVVDGKLVDIHAKCDDEHIDFDDGMVICEVEGDNDGDYPFADDGSLMKYPNGDRIGNERANYVDLKHYIVENENDDAVAIYADGNVVKSYNDVYSTRIINGEDDEYYYYVRTRKGENYTTIVLKTDGTEIFKQTADYYFTINTISGDRIIAYDYGCTYSSCKNKRESGDYLFDTEGKKIYGPVYNLDYVNENYFMYQTGSRYYDEDIKYGLLDRDGKEVLSNAEYVDYDSTDSGVIAARKETDNGYVYVVLDKDFNVITEFAYRDADFYNDYCVIKKDDSRIYYNLDMKEIYKD